jgi:hypothetical protein
MRVNNSNDPTEIFDKHYDLKCPHCGNSANISAVSIPRYEYLARFRPKTVGIAYRCDSCNFPIFLRFKVNNYDLGNNRIVLEEAYEEVERPQETFEYKYLPAPVAEDFREALTCYSHACYNAFAALCRRCAQSAFTELGAAGKDKVLDQLKEIKETAALDDDTFSILQQVVISGHDGAHPHLPRLSPERAAILLELMKDVMYQLFVRKAKIQEAVQLRKQDIAQTNT